MEFTVALRVKALKLIADNNVIDSMSIEDGFTVSDIYELSMILWEEGLYLCDDDCIKGTKLSKKGIQYIKDIEKNNDTFTTS